MRRRLDLSLVTLALVAAAAGAGCTIIGPTLQVTPSRASGAAAKEKPSDCALDFFRTKPPDRPYDEVATVHYLAVNGAEPTAVQTAIQAKVCSLGGDAVIVTRERYLGYSQGGTEVTATAVQYRAAQ
jgi:hypothetical protein